MEKEERTVNKMLVSSAAEQAVEKQKRSKRVYGEYSPVKGAIISKVVTDISNNVEQALSRNKCQYGDFDSLKEYTQGYLTACANNQLLPTMQGWAIALGICRANLYKWFDNASDCEFQQFLLLVRDAILEATSQNAFLGTVNTIWAIFYSKNNYNMSDKTEISLSAPTNHFGPQASPEELQRKYIEATSADFEE